MIMYKRGVCKLRNKLYPCVFVVINNKNFGIFSSLVYLLNFFEYIEFFVIYIRNVLIDQYIKLCFCMNRLCLVNWAMFMIYNMFCCT